MLKQIMRVHTEMGVVEFCKPHDFEKATFFVDLLDEQDDELYELIVWDAHGLAKKCGIYVTRAQDPYLVVKYGSDVVAALFADRYWNSNNEQLGDDDEETYLSNWISVVVDERFRRLGLASDLVRAITSEYEHAEYTVDYDFVFFAECINKASAALFNKLGWTEFARGPVVRVDDEEDTRIVFTYNAGKGCSS